jgi:hypothetical protein
MRALAQRPLPSMMMAICRGNAVVWSSIFNESMTGVAIASTGAG